MIPFHYGSGSGTVPVPLLQRFRFRNTAVKGQTDPIISQKQNEHVTQTKKLGTVPTFKGATFTLKIL